MPQYNKIKGHFREKDKKIYQILKKIKLDGVISTKPKSQYFSSVCKEIITQQLSDKAADKIIYRFFDLFGHGHLEPLEVLRMPDKAFREIGMSWAKASYIKNTARAFLERKKQIYSLESKKDEEVIEVLTSIKGIGRWTAEMFLIFTLGREDVFSYGDLGLKKAIERIYEISSLKREQVEKIVSPWSPYRSWGCIALWRFND